MNYIDIPNGVQLRDRGGKGKGHLHAVIGVLPGGVIVMQSRDHKQIVQSAIHPDGELVIAYFEEMPNKQKRKLAEETIRL